MKQNRLKAVVYIITHVLIVVNFIFIPLYSWFTSGSETKGITSVRGNSMMPTVEDNDMLYIQPIQYKRGEMVVALCPETNKYTSSYNTALLKRIVGLPGEIIEITKAGVLINGVLLDETYTNNQEYTLLESNDIDEIILSNNEYFLLGDNREDSFDSRNVGAVPSSNFLYGLTIEPNDYTYKIWKTAIIKCLVNLFCIIVSSIIIFVLLTSQKSDVSQLQQDDNYDGVD